MVLKARNAFIPILGIALAMQAGACKKDKDSNTDLLVGEWEIVELDGDPLEYKTTFRFDEDQDFRICAEDEYNNNNCYNGDWDWVGSDEDEVDMDWEDDDGESYSVSLKIESITKDQIEGEMELDGDTYNVTLEKI